MGDVLRIALDFDGTFTTNPGMWLKVIKTFQDANVDVICITSRFPNVPVTGIPVPVYYACGQQKADFAHERGLEVDVWIDDMPSCIGGPQVEPGQAVLRRQLIRQVFDANFPPGPFLVPIGDIANVPGGEA